MITIVFTTIQNLLQNYNTTFITDKSILISLNIFYYHQILSNFTTFQMSCTMILSHSDSCNTPNCSILMTPSGTKIPPSLFELKEECSYNVPQLFVFVASGFFMIGTRLCVIWQEYHRSDSVTFSSNPNTDVASINHQRRCPCSPL